MLKFIGIFLTAMLVAAGAAQAIEYNQWQLMPQKKSAGAKQAGAPQADKPDSEKAGASTGQRPKKQAERVRLVNVKDKNHKFALACRAHSGRLQMLVLFSGGADKMLEQTGKTTLSLMIDGKSVLKNNDSRYRRVARGNMAVRTVLQGDAVTHFLSQFLAAKKVITVSYGKEAAESYTVTKAGSNGLALQSCLLK
ncbi:hypothetical protein [Candidatus Tokpelaia sp.]|uniref:hypothetical protein n=1 Tax=Candidatus Tokpelaia sp. TaxID=2233777 RepID=UPI00123A3824|nr:hypothetical protein [Candidatus Tokpelaia sp.]KAA6404536.1 hypothetical protein DPQ22_09475 [Candidatus Tokpelaia sp.]